MKLKQKVGHAFWIAFCVEFIQFNVAYMWDTTWAGLGLLIVSTGLFLLALCARIYFVILEYKNPVDKLETFEYPE